MKELGLDGSEIDVRIGHWVKLLVRERRTLLGLSRLLLLGGDDELHHITVSLNRMWFSLLGGDDGKLLGESSLEPLRLIFTK